ncbi:MAG: DUF1573 domain-containing protein [Bacteroidetes bacterium]|nr:DUF1573 domain-containing protein [Bacteroidota bacterium]
MKKITYLFMFLAGMALAQEKAVIQLNPKPAPQQTQPTATVSPTAPEITFTETTHDFGNVKKGAPVVYKFNYKNTGKEALIIFDCKAGCHCTTPKCSKEPLKPGKTGFIEVHYDSMRVGSFAKEVIVTSNAKNAYVNLVIKGVVVGEAEGTDEKSPVKNEEKMKETENKHQ